MTSKLSSCPKVKSFPLLSCFIYSLGSIYLFYNLPSSLEVVPTPTSLQLRIGHVGSFKNLRSRRTVEYIVLIYILILIEYIIQFLDSAHKQASLPHSKFTIGRRVAKMVSLWATFPELAIGW